MPYNEEINNRIKDIVAEWPGTNAKKMFGGVCHLLQGNMFCGVYKEFLILRLGKKNTEGVMEQPHIRPFDITGKPMKGWVMVEQEGFATEEALSQWLTQAAKFAATLPPK
ncbi:MAG: TfoX/Sxy family protein [bacterium]|nr:TfoX/Sxy family protein [bacterium]